ncbi:MAG TPA: adenylate/guanylate cyclase domain-containing protein [Mycobacteriales bacterium]|nr:adenylate/guanylate cyclase domain-containing protein [Mycobacteriales bacterium]
MTSARARADVACPSCGAANVRGAVLCGRCEVSLVPAERRLVTLLFADLAGYTSLGAALDPEDLHQLVAPLVAAMRRLVEDYGAVVPGVQGDGFMAVFGAPLAHEDDPRRAVLAAAELQRLVGRWQASRAGQPVPDVHIGVHAGEAFVAPGRDGLTVTGDPVNVASRLCDEAAGGEVVVSDAVVAMLPGIAAWDAPRAVRLRNRPEPVVVRSLVWRELSSSAGARSTRGAVALVDRDEVMAELDRLLVPTGSGRLAVLVGEAGVGKSRVANEWLDRLSEHLVLRGHAPAFASPSWTAPLAETLWRLARERTGDGLLPPRAALDEVMRLSGPLSAGIARRLGRLLGVEPDSSEVDTDDAQADAFTVWLERVAQRRRLVLLLEDLYWAAPPLIERLPRLADAAGPGSVVLAAARPETPNIAELVRIDVPPLDDADQHALVERLLPGCPAAVAELLVGRSGGNPFFAEEVAQLLVDDRTITVDESGVRVADPDRLTAVPTTMRLFVTARLDLLSPATRRVMGAAAVAGDALEPAVLAVLCSDLDVSAALDELVARGLLRHRAARTAAEARRGGRLAFRHALVRDVAYDGLSRAERRELHDRAARWYAELDVQTLDAVVARAVHAESALALAGPGDARYVRPALVALERWARAVEEEQPTTAHEVALRGLTLAEADDDLQAAARLALLAGNVALALGNEHEASELAERAIRVTADPLVSAEALLLGGRALSYQWHSAEAVDVLDAAVAAFERAGSSAGVARAQAEQARAVSAGIVPMLDGFERAAGHADGVDRPLFAQLAREAAYLAAAVGGERYTRWIERARGSLAHDDVVGTAWVDLTRALHAFYDSDLPACLDLARSARGAVEQLGLIQVHLPAAHLEIEALSRVGRLADAVALLEQTMAVARNRPPRTVFFTELSAVFASVRSGAVTDRTARTTSLDLPPSQLEAEDPLYVARTDARIALDRGDFAGAISHAARASVGMTALDQPMAALESRLVALFAQVARLDVSADLRALPDDAERLGAHVTAGLARRLLVQDALLSGSAAAVPDEPALDLVEARALDHENRALAAGGDADAFAAAAREWEVLGHTAFHARALTWAGDEERAAAVLEALQSPPGLIEEWRAQLAAVRR